MTAIDIAALFASVHDPLACAALGDWLEEIGDDDAAEMVRTMSDDLMPLLEARRILAERGNVRCNSLSIYPWDGHWKWSNFQPTESHPRPTALHVVPRTADGFVTDAEAGRGDSPWLERFFDRVAARANRPGDFALRDALMAFLGLERLGGFASKGKLIRLEMSRKTD